MFVALPRQRHSSALPFDLRREQGDAGVETACELGECPGARLDDAALDLRDLCLSDPGAVRELGLADPAVEAKLEELVRDS